jgi:signal transduction histidine kinase
LNTRPPRRRILISFAGFYLAFAAVAARAYFTLKNDPSFWIMIGMLAFYLLLLAVEPWLISRKPAYLHVINTLQAGIGLGMLVGISYFDTFALLLIIPCAQSILYFPRKTAFIWIGAIVALDVAALLSHFPINEAVGFVIIYPAGIFLVSGFCYLALQAEEAQNRSEALMADLQKANLKLQAYAAQVQELAAAEERNRLARELHDSVTQIIFGLTLSAQAAQLLIHRDLGRASAELDHIQVLAQNALAEMRALIQQLHPRSVAEKGLEASLHRLAEERQTNDDLAVAVEIKGERSLPANIQEELFRIAQEALNNIVKHAQTDHAAVTLNLEDENRVLMEIEDGGVGFDPSKVRTLPGHLGLTSMSERIQALGGSLVIDSKPGMGTRLRVELALDQEVEHA